MPDFNVRSDSVNVEQIMEQIRSRIREKRGVDYTEQQIRELAAVKLEKFLDPRGVRSDLLAEFRKSQPAPAPYTVPLYPFEDTTLFDSHRAIVRFLRRLFAPLLKLFFNANALSQSLHAQSEINRQTVERVQNMEASLRQTGDLYYELLHNLVLELTRATIEVKNMKMQVESLAGRLEFNERRARALESAVVYRPSGEETTERRERNGQTVAPETRPERQAVRESVGAGAPSSLTGGVPTAPGQPGEGPGQRSRRRRRRRGRRGGASAVAVMGGQAPVPQTEAPAGNEAEAQTRGEEAGGDFDEPETSHEADTPAEPPQPAPPAREPGDSSDQ
jgi:hypothetical protein